MGKVTGFLEIDRQDRKYAAGVRSHPPFPRVHDPARRGGDARPGGALHGLRHSVSVTPAARCNNQIPDWNDLVYKDDWHEALRNLHSTNNFPEFTGRVCPAPCEEACTLNLEDAPVTIKTIECAIADKRLAGGLDRPGAGRYAHRQARRRHRLGAGGPCRRAAARARRPRGACLREERRSAGGLLRYGIPDFKMEKHHIDRRVEQMEAEGVIFHCGVNVGVTSLGREAACAISTPCCFAGGAEKPRDLAVAGPRSRRRAFRHGFPAAAEPARLRRERRCRRPDPRLRQARRRHRRRRHRLRLHRHLVPPGRAVGHAARDHAAARPSGRTSR